MVFFSVSTRCLHQFSRNKRAALLRDPSTLHADPLNGGEWRQSRPMRKKGSTHLFSAASMLMLSMIPWTVSMICLALIVCCSNFVFTADCEIHSCEAIIHTHTHTNKHTLSGRLPRGERASERVGGDVANTNAARSQYGRDHLLLQRSFR